MKCIQCDGRLELHEDAVITQIFKGETLQVKSPAYVCTSCGKPYLKDKQGDILRRNTADEYRLQHQLLTSTEIKDCRKALKLNQEQFAEFLQVSPVSVKRWETWQVQEQIYDQRIREKCHAPVESLVPSMFKSHVYIVVRKVTAAGSVKAASRTIPKTNVHKQIRPRVTMHSVVRGGVETFTLNDVALAS